jgi:hypothetical protein
MQLGIYPGVDPGRRASSVGAQASPISEVRGMPNLHVGVSTRLQSGLHPDLLIPG